MLSMLSLISVYLLDLYLNVICLNVSPIRLLGLLGTSVFFQFGLRLGLWYLTPLLTVLQLYREFFSNEQTWMSYAYIYPALGLFEQSFFFFHIFSHWPRYIFSGTTITLNCCFSPKHIPIKHKQIDLLVRSQGNLS